MAICAPGPNSYRRFRVRGLRAAAPDVVHQQSRLGDPRARSDADNLRIEHRLAGADANPYLVLAWILAGMLHGLETRWSRRRCSPATPTRRGDPLPTNWLAAIERFSASAFARETFGAKFVASLSRVKRAEMRGVRLARHGARDRAVSRAACEPRPREQNYYFATTPPPPPHAPLRGETRADVCIVGGGISGLSAALHLAERGFSVALLEAKHLGFGGSGRSGGQSIFGYASGQEKLEKARRRRRRALHVGHRVEGMKLQRELIARTPSPATTCRPHARRREGAPRRRAARRGRVAARQVRLRTCAS
jgi:hypothetical protein